MGNTIPDIPRLYTVIAEWASCLMIVLLLKPKIGRAQLALMSAVYLVCLALFMGATATITLWLWIPCMLVAFFSIAFFIWYSNKTSFYEAIYYAVLAFSIAECIASIDWQLINFFFIGAKDIPFWIEAISLVVVYGMVLFVAWRLLVFRMPKEKRLDIERKDWLTALFIGIIVFGFSNLSFVGNSSGFTGQYSREIANVRTLVDVAGVSMLYAHFLACCNNMVRHELEAVHNVLENQYVQYKQSRESIDLINMKYHDLKHQIHMLRDLNDKEQRDAFLDRMEADIKAHELQNKTGNSVLDTLLTGKSMYCHKHGITMTVVADGSLLRFMDAMDICSIFGNALDNAIESAVQISDREKRLIHLTVSQVKSFVMIRVENYFEGDLLMDSDGPKTKKDKKFHGYGIKSIKYTVNRYGGVVKIGTKDRWFQLKILIPIKD